MTVPHRGFSGTMKHNETTEQNNNNNCEESQLAGGKPVGYLQVQLGS